MKQTPSSILAFQKKIGLLWEEKEEAIEGLIQSKEIILKEIKNRRIGSSGPIHQLIESDNLAALHLLENQKAEFDLIYIDPPYNTGNKDFKYNDHFVDADDLYRHSKWISFMYKRLLKAKNLLTETGVIFISIDDYEQARLKLLCDGIFRQQNFVANFIRKNKSGSGHDSKQVAVEFDYVLCYAKNSDQLKFTKAEIKVEEDKKYRFSDSFVSKRGKYYLRDLDYKGSYSKTLDYEITAPDGTKLKSGNQIGPPNTWRWSKEKFEWGLENDFIVFKQTSGTWKVYIKQYQYVDNKDQKRVRTLPHRALINFSNSKGSNELKNMMQQSIFSYPKPTDLIQFIIQLIPEKDIRILDFFAGSGRTMHATLLQNKEDGGKRTCTIVTNNENKICEEVTYERNKKAILGYTNKSGKQVKGLIDNQLQYFKLLFKNE